MKPYYADTTTTLYCGDSRELVPGLGITADLIVADPPYQETALGWDKWPQGWPAVLRFAAPAMWCFGSVRMFIGHRDEFGHWQLSQDVIWEKNAGSGRQADRFSRVHEHALHWYRGLWRDVYHDTPREGHPVRGSTITMRVQPAHYGEMRRHTWIDDGTRLMRSVLRVQNMRTRALHPTEKPVGILDPLIRYACKPGGLVLDPFAGSGSTAEAARLSGRKAVLIEADERYCETIANRLSQLILTEPS